MATDNGHVFAFYVAFTAHVNQKVSAVLKKQALRKLFKNILDKKVILD